MVAELCAPVHLRDIEPQELFLTAGRRTYRRIAAGIAAMA
jgi:hypothetical protein